jgi:D-xylose transport system substrate-binding protein
MKNLILIIVTFLSFSSCQISVNNKVAFLIPDAGQVRWQKDELFFKERAKELKLDAVIYDAKSNEETQFNQALELIKSGVKVLVIGSVNANVAAAIVREAHKSNVKVIAYDRLIKNSELDYYVSHNNVQVGEEMAKYAVKIKSSGNFMILLGDHSDQNALFIKQGIMNVLQPQVDSRKITIIYTAFIERWKDHEAYFMVNRFLKFSPEPIDAIIASNDGIAKMAIQALTDNGIVNDIVITGQNADIFAVKNIISGKQSMTVYKPLKELAYTAVDLANQLLKNQVPTGIVTTINNGKVNVPAILIPVQSVDKEKIESVLISKGFYTKSEVYGN